MNSRDVLTRARELILRRGWIQGSMGNSWNGYCLFGAIDTGARQLTEELDPDDLRHFQLNDFVSSVMGCVRISLGGEGPINWNDQPGRTKEEVLVVLDETIKTATAAALQTE